LERDDLYAQPWESIPPFSFDAKVARVFDDMALRSIPFYAQMQEMCAELCSQWYKKKGYIYDLGCSTGNTLLALGNLLHSGAQVVALDSSGEMLARCRMKLEDYGFLGQVELRNADLLEAEFPQAEIIILHYVSQFISPGDRIQLYKKIHRSLLPGGLFLLSEKTQSEDPELQNQLTRLYHSWKEQQGYSKLEIAQKRSALERVLIPSTQSEIKNQLRESGFSFIQTLIQWGPFSTYAVLP